MHHVEHDVVVEFAGAHVCFIGSCREHFRVGCARRSLCGERESAAVAIRKVLKECEGVTYLERVKPYL